MTKITFEEIVKASSISDLQRISHQMAMEKGWWSDYREKSSEHNVLPEKIALMHSELSEALEEVREGRPAFWLRDLRNVQGNVYAQKPEGWATEMADCIIRIMDVCGFFGVDLEKIIQDKIAYNATRPFKHGDKKL